MSIQTTIYEPNQRSKTGLFGTMLIVGKNIYQSRELIYQLYRRDFLMNYKKSFLGMGWLIFAPVMGIISWVFMNSAGVLTPGDVGVPYPVYVMLSTSIWTLFISFYTNSGLTLQVAQSFIQQVNFHHEALLVKQGLQDVTNFGITLVINIIFMFFMGVLPHWQIVLLPVMLLPVFFIAASVGLFVSIISTITTDIQRIATFMLSLFMFVTPVIYSAKLNIPWLQKIIYYNPLTYLVCGPRDLILYGRINHFENYWYALGLAIILFSVSLRFFLYRRTKSYRKNALKNE